MLKRENYIDGVIGPQSYHQIPEVLKKIEYSKKKINKTEFDVIEKFDKLNLIKNTNAKFLPILQFKKDVINFVIFV